MAKIIAMIPVRLGSKRIKSKNLRLINGKPLVSYILEATIDANKKYKLFDDIYINSEADIFNKIADEYGVKFYKRPEFLSEDHIRNDDYAYDFIENHECDILVQLLATSPFILPDDIYHFIKAMIKGKYETMKTITNICIECTLDGKPINYNQFEKTILSQHIKPVQQNVGAIMGWDCNKFIQNMKKYNAAYNGGAGTVGFYEIKGFSVVDIDYEYDFLLAETIIEYLKNSKDSVKQYYTYDKKL